MTQIKDTSLNDQNSLEIKLLREEPPKYTEVSENVL